jgi:hypothetical protein
MGVKLRLVGNRKRKDKLFIGLNTYANRELDHLFKPPLLKVDSTGFVLIDNLSKVFSINYL